MPKAPNKPTDDTALIKALADILDEAGLAELEYETDDVAIRLSRVTSAPPVMAAAPVATTAAAVSAPAAAVGGDLGAHPGALKSPMVGTVYVSAEPGAPAFIAEGDSVKKGQTLLIVEAMKVMNPITAPQDGTVTKILVKNAQPIEFGEVLVVIE
ncbi:acetyl-CoA carboxylase, biotin carboxyl carrier protein [Alphaproteobacteria bacterium]|jgi:acetyl-CoA carboxylase biotin carboxyl carrier protein|nr:acetyl-CoA carboxylase, biotin carboxyl carrier protein [Alphaproteobacteria bacterium]